MIAECNFTPRTIQQQHAGFARIDKGHGVLGSARNMGDLHHGNRHLWAAHPSCAAALLFMPDIRGKRLHPFAGVLFMPRSAIFAPKKNAGASP